MPVGVEIFAPISPGVYRISLRRLVVILGGRENISEIQYDSLEELEIFRVLGFNNIDSSMHFLPLDRS